MTRDSLILEAKMAASTLLILAFTAGTIALSFGICFQ